MKVDWENVQKLLFEDDLTMCMARAEAGDIESARHVLPALAVLLSTKNINPQTGETLPVPEFAREYFARAIGRMVAGVDANEAMNLTKGSKRGPIPDPYLRKLLIGYLVELHRVEDGMTVDDASHAASKMLEQIIRQKKADGFWGPWEVFREKNHCSEDTARNNYNEVKDVVRRAVAASTS